MSCFVIVLTHLAAIAGGYILVYSFVNDVISEYIPYHPSDGMIIYNVPNMLIALVLRSYLWVIGLLHLYGYFPYIVGLVVS